MKVGDSKKAIVLGVIALVAVGAAVFRLVPRSVITTPAAQSQPQQTVEGNNFDQPKGLVTRPFSHPLLAQREGGSEQNPAKLELVSGPPSRGASAGHSLLPPLSFIAQGEPEDNRKSEPEQEPVVTVRLQAILSSMERVALLEVGGAVKRLKEGDTLLAGVKVKAISSDSVTFQTPHGEETILVGAKREWKTK